MHVAPLAALPALRDVRAPGEERHLRDPERDVAASIGGDNIRRDDTRAIRVLELLAELRGDEGAQRRVHRVRRARTQVQVLPVVRALAGHRVRLVHRIVEEQILPAFLLEVLPPATGGVGSLQGNRLGFDLGGSDVSVPRWLTVR